MKTILLFILCLIPTLSHAAYNAAEVDRNELTAAGSARLVTLFTGNAGEPPVRREYLVNASSTLSGYRQWVKATMDELNLMRAVGVLPGLQPGQTVTPLNPVAPSLTAKETWHRKVESYSQSCTLSFVGTVATACSALKTDIESTYQAGYLD